MKFRTRPITKEATQWFKNGDHPKDNSILMESLTEGRFLTEGKIVRYYRTPKIDGVNKCKHCSVIMHEHGWIDTLEGGHIVCPGDWIVTGLKGEYYPVKPDIFEKTYERIEPETC